MRLANCPHLHYLCFGRLVHTARCTLLDQYSLQPLITDQTVINTEYQAVIRELWSLDYALLEVESLLRSCKQSVELTALRETTHRCAEECRKCVEGFRDQTKKYQRALQTGSTRNLIRDTTAKIRWHVSLSDDLAKFRANITAQTSSLNMLLATASV